MVSGLIQSRVSTVLDAMGQASALAQDLRAPITSGTIVKSLPCFFQIRDLRLRGIIDWVPHLASR